MMDLTFIFDIQEKILNVGCQTWEDKVIEGSVNGT